MEIEQEDVVLCTVEKISGTTVFVSVEGTEKSGSIVFSEVAPGRIRNIRDYVVPKKTLVCKVLKINPNNLELSLRRVKEKERKEVTEQYKIEKSYVAILKSILGEKTKEIINQIKNEDTIYNFLEEAKEDSKKLQELVGKENTDKIIEILNSQKKKSVILKKQIEFSTQRPDGLNIIKEILGNIKEAEVKYIAAGKYSLNREDEDLKKADTKLMQIISNIEKEAKSSGVDFKYKE